jgi:Tol biopolymer transport system component
VIALPNGEDLVFSARERRKFPQIYKMNKAGGDFQRLTNDLNIYRDISLSKDGKSLVALQKNSYSHIWLFPEVDPENGVQLTFGKGNRDGKHGIDFLPDGKVVFTSLEDMNRDLWTVNPKDGAKQQLTKNLTDINERPLVSNDGNYIYFNALNGKTFSIERLGVNDNKIEQITNESNKTDFFPTVSSDGTTLYFVRLSKGKSVIYKKILPAGEESEVKLPKGFTADSFLMISPDGRFLAVRQADEEKRFELEEEFSNAIKIGIIPLDESGSSNAKIIKITTNKSQFRWNETSDAIYFIKHTEENTGIWKKYVFAETQPEKIFELPKMKIYNFQLTADQGMAASIGKHIDDVVLISNFD